MLKLLTGGLRVGVSARLAKQALADLGGVDVTEIEEVWSGQHPPYEDLFAWLEKRSEKPSADTPGRFRPVMLAQAIDDSELRMKLDPEDFSAEWKWDGIRVQAVSERGQKTLYSRTGEDIGKSFPDVIQSTFSISRARSTANCWSCVTTNWPHSVVVSRGSIARPRMQSCARHTLPPFVRATFLWKGKRICARCPSANAASGLKRFSLPQSNLLARIDLHLRYSRSKAGRDLASLRANPPEGDARLAEGLMLKRWDSIYEAGRPKGPWFKWKRDPHLIDAVLMYAQRGHGKRSGFYSDYTFGVWREDANSDRKLTPVGKAYFGFTDDELKQIDKFVRDNTVDRHGPVRVVKANKDFRSCVRSCVPEGLQRFRRATNLASRCGSARISRLRWDKPAREADELSTLEKMPRVLKRLIVLV